MDHRSRYSARLRKELREAQEKQRRMIDREKKNLNTIARAAMLTEHLQSTLDAIEVFSPINRDCLALNDVPLRSPMYHDLDNDHVPTFWEEVLSVSVAASIWNVRSSLSRPISNIRT